MDARRFKDEDGTALVAALAVIGALVIGWPALKERYPEARKLDRDAQHLVRTVKQEYRASDGARVGDLLGELR